MLELINQFGGRKDVVIVLLITAVLFLINSSIKNRTIRVICSTFSALFIVGQLFSLYVTQSFINYQFYVHANLRGIIGMQNLFLFQAISATIGLIFLLVLNIYSHKLLKRVNALSSIRNKHFLKITRASFIVLFSAIILLQGNFISDSKTLLPLVSFGNSAGFKEVLSKNNMQDYVTPDKVECSAGRNIIIISMESLELSFLNGKYAHLTPNLNKLKQKWQFIPMKPSIGSEWTSGSLYTYLTGFPAFFGTKANTIFQTAYHTEISSISHVLNQAKYRTTYLNGNTNYSGVKEMLNIFEFDKVIDCKNTPKTGFESNYGLRDKDLFRIAKREIENYKRSEKPFALFISTTDTHFPNGIYDCRMESVIPTQKTELEFTVASLDYLIGDFIEFLEQSAVLDNTTIYLFPDHLKMGDPSIFESSEERSLYVITNAKDIEQNSEEIYQIDLPKIILDGSDVKHNLKFLTDYIPGDKNEYITENILGITEINTAGVTNSTVEAFDVSNVSRNYTRYKTDTSRFIAHAGGMVDDNAYTNSKEALDLNYKRGFRLFELDIIKTKDEQFVAAHDWNYWATITEYNGELPVTRDQFLSRKILGKYTPLDMAAINQWFKAHDDAILVTDKVNDPKAISELFIDKKRLIMELFDEQAVNEGLESGILSAMPSQSVVDRLDKRDVETLAKRGVKNIAISRFFIKDHKELLQEFKKYGIKPYAYHINYGFDIGIDEEYVVKYEMDYIFGIYADEWQFE